MVGLKVAGGTLWALNNSDGESALLRLDLAWGRESRRLTQQGQHFFNDLVAPHGTELQVLSKDLDAANGIALSSDGKFLYVSAFPDGIRIVDRKTGKGWPVRRPVDIGLGMIDGLYLHRGALIAIQNGFMAPRVVRLPLSADGQRVLRLEVLETFCNTKKPPAALT